MDQGSGPRSTSRAAESESIASRWGNGTRTSGVPQELLRWTWRARRASQGASFATGATTSATAGPAGRRVCWGYRFREALPYLVSLRGSDVPGYSERLARWDPVVFRRLSRRVWTEAGAVVAVSESLRALALRTCPDLDVRVIPNAADTVRFYPGPDVDRYTVLFVGRLIPRKNVADLLTAFRGVP